MNPDDLPQPMTMQQAQAELAARMARARAAGVTVSPAEQQQFLAEATGRAAATVVGGATPSGPVPQVAAADAAAVGPSPNAVDPFAGLTGKGLLYRVTRDYNDRMARAQAAGAAIPLGAQAQFINEATHGQFTLDDVEKANTENAGDLNVANLIRAGEQGATLGWSDELAGALSGGQAETERIRLALDNFKRAHPVASILTNVAGGLAIPGIGEVKAMKAIPALKAAWEAHPLLTAIGAGAVSGGVLGGVGGAGSAEPGQRMQAAEAGGLLGAGLGAAAPIVAEPAVATARRLLGLETPLNAAERQIGQAIDMTPGGADAVSGAAQLYDATGRGDLATIADASPALQALARNAATKSPEAQGLLATTLANRQGIPERLSQDVVDVLGGDVPDASARMQAMVNSRRAWAANAYDQLRTQNPLMGVSVTEDGTVAPWSADQQPLADVLNRPVVGKAIDRAVSDGTLSGPADQGNLSFAALHDIRRTLDAQAGQAYRAGNGELGKALASARNDLDNALGAQLPDYAAIQAQYMSRKAGERALAAGVKAMRLGDDRDIAQQIANMSPDQLEQFRYGLGSALVARLRAARDNPSVARWLDQAGPGLNAKLSAAFGDGDALDQFLARVQAENQLAGLRPVTPGVTSGPTAPHISPYDIGHGSLWAVLGHPAVGLEMFAARPALAAFRQAAATRTAAEIGKTLLAPSSPDAVNALLARFVSAPARWNTAPYASALAGLLAPAAAPGLLPQR